MHSIFGGGLMTDNNRLYWLGNEDMSLNKHTIRVCGEITLGYYGGNTDSGAYKNEDGALLLDAHSTNESANLVLETIKKEQYLWWMYIGDNLVYLFHPELIELNQFALNQRQFYEWVGKVNTFDLDIPCYTTGTRLLREGQNYIYLQPWFKVF